MKRTVADESVAEITARSLTAPGADTTCCADVTVIAAEPVLPPLMAVIVAVPTPAPVTRPVALTDATAALLVVQFTGWPFIALPDWSSRLAVSCCIAPTTTDAEAGVTLTVVTTAAPVTVIAAVPDFPPEAAVIVAEPAASALTKPVALTVTAAALLDVHVTVWPLITLFDWSRTVAASCCDAPTATDAAAGVTLTVVTTGATALTLIAAVPVFPLRVAVIVADPAATALTKPLALTVAIPLLLEVHVTG